MQDILNAVLSLEGVAVVTALAYLLLAARENLWCWICAFISSVLYVWIFWNARLYMESVLNVYYVVMAVWGWWSWRYGGQRHEGLRIRMLPWWQHCALIAATLCLALANGWLMQRYTAAAMPFVDALVTWGAVVTTVLVVRKVLENWVYWLVIDGVSMLLYIDRGLYLTALLFAGYLVIVLLGLRTWWRQYQQEREEDLPRGTPEVA
jgi:nicotinamide mononucleotide transporter